MYLTPESCFKLTPTAENMTQIEPSEAFVAVKAMQSVDSQNAKHQLSLLCEAIQWSLLEKNQIFNTETTQSTNEMAAQKINSIGEQEPSKKSKKKSGSKWA